MTDRITDQPLTVLECRALLWNLDQGYEHTPNEAVLFESAIAKLRHCASMELADETRKRLDAMMENIITNIDDVMEGPDV